MHTKIYHFTVSVLISDEEKYHLRNNLYTACKTGNKADLKNLLAVFLPNFLPQTYFAERVGTSGNSHHGIVVVQQCRVSKIPTDNNNDKDNVDNGSRDNSKNVEERTPDETDSLECDGGAEVSDEIVVEKQSGAQPVQNEANSVLTESLKNVIDEGVNSETKMTEVENNSDKKTDNIKTIENTGKDENTTCVENEAKGFAELTKSKGSVEDNLDNSKKEKNEGNSLEDHSTEKDPSNGETSKESVQETAKDKAKDTGKESSEIRPESGRQIQVIEDMSPVVTLDMLSEQFGDNSTTLLHVAAKEGHGTVVMMLMDAGANPCIR